jgi:hypothetical protein
MNNFQFDFQGHFKYLSKRVVARFAKTKKIIGGIILPVAYRYRCPKMRHAEASV